MSEAENKLLVRNFIAEVMNTGNLDRLHEFVAPAFRDQSDPSGRTPAGDPAGQSRILSSRTPDGSANNGRPIE
jgi:hypothetical protein